MLISKSIVVLTAGAMLGLGLLGGSAQTQVPTPNPIQVPLPQPQAVEAAKPPETIPALHAAHPAHPMVDPSLVVNIQAETDLNRMQGRWIVKKSSLRQPKEAVAKNQMGPIFEAEDIKEIWFRGNEIWMAFGKCEGLIGTFGLSETYNPTRIELEIPGDADRSKMAYGVYTFTAEGNLVMLLGPDRLRRPNFESEEGTVSSLVRELLLEKKIEPATPMPADLADLQGTWLVTSCSDEGKPTTEVSHLHIQGTTLSLEARNGAARFFIRSSFTMNSARFPHWIDMEGGILENDGALRTRGIYSLEDGILSMVFGKKNQSRPSEFVSEPNSESFLMMAKRITPGPAPVRAEVPPRTTVNPAVTTPRNPVPSPTPMVAPNPTVTPTRTRTNDPLVTPVNLPLPAPKPADPAPKPIEPTVKPTDVIEVASTKFMLPFQIQKQDQETIRKLIIWVSHDRGRTFNSEIEWFKLDAPGIPYEASREGEIHFAVQAVDAQGTASPPHHAIQSQLKVLVRSFRPTGLPPLNVTAPSLSESDRLRKENADLRQKVEALLQRVDRLEKAVPAKK